MSTQAILQELQAREAIRELKAQYCDACDDDHNGTRVAALFTPDGSWQYEGQPAHVGRKAIESYMFSVRDARGMRNSAHLVSNPVIHVMGQHASAQWRFAMLYTSADGKTHHRIVGRYEDEYVFTDDGRWLFQSLLVRVEERGHFPNLEES